MMVMILAVLICGLVGQAFSAPTWTSQLLKVTGVHTTSLSSSTSKTATCDASTLASKMMGCGQSGTVSTGNSACAAFGTFEGYFGLQDGIVLSTGHVSALETAYDPSSYQNGEDHGNSGETGDVVTLSLTFNAPTDGYASLKYVFASQEMPTFFGSQFNDDAEIKINGVVASVLPNGLPLTINNVGNKSYDQSTWISDFVQISSSTTGVPQSMTGYVKIQTAVAAVNAGSNNITVRVADKSDGRFNTAIFIEGHSVCFRETAPPISDAQAKTMNISPVQLPSPPASTGDSGQDQCACTGCTAPFWESGNYPGNITKQECFEMCRDNTHNVEHSTYLERGAGVIGTVTGSSRANCKFALYDSALEVNCKHAGGNCPHTKFQKCWLYHHDDMTRAAGPSTSKYSCYQK